MATTMAEKEVPFGQGAAALISAGIGTLVIGLLTTGAVISAGLKEFLAWYGPTGPLSGKTSLGVIAWLVSWLILGIAWKDKDLAVSKVLTATLVLIGIGLVLTFPPVFEAFE